MKKIKSSHILGITMILLFTLSMITAGPVEAQNFANVSMEQAETTKSPSPDDTPASKSQAAYSHEVQNILNRVASVEGPSFAEQAGTAPDPGLDMGSSSTYTLGPTDIIEIKVMRHPEVSGDYMLNQEGKIQYEFVGDIVISGLTKEEAEQKISSALEEYIISPEVSVKITGYNSKIVYVVGEVGAPGKIFMRGDTITIREALMQAGLPRLTGKTRKSKLITPTEDGKPDIREVDVYALLYEGDLRHNMDMEPGDVIFVPATFLTKTMRALQPVAAPIGTAAGTGRTVTTGF